VDHGCAAGFALKDAGKKPGELDIFCLNAIRFILSHASLGFDERGLVNNGGLLAVVDFAVELNLPEIGIVVEDVTDSVRGKRVLSFRLFEVLNG
jgi:hypothetical protein